MVFQRASLTTSVIMWMAVVADESIGEEPAPAPTFTWSPTITPFPFFSMFDETASPTFVSNIHNFDCFNCIENGYSFCPLDALCWNNATSPFQTDNLPLLPFSCQTPDDMLADDSQLCSPPENFFSDPLYATNEWVFDMINVRPAWEKGYFGASVAIRVNDGGFQVDHLEVRTDSLQMETEETAYQHNWCSGWNKSPSDERQRYDFSS
jgi:hypothetical protein